MIMMQGKQQISVYELFYDLIFAYAVSRMVNVLSIGERSYITWQSLDDFLIVALAFFGIWIYQSMLSNRFFNIHSSVPFFLFFDMFWILVLSQKIQENFEQTHELFAGVSSILFLSLAVQYFLKLRTNRDEASQKICQPFAIILLLCSILSFTTIFDWGSYFLRFTIYALSLIVAVAFPIINRKILSEYPSSFERMAKRYRFLLLFLFGEAVIAIAQVISSHPISVKSALFFVLIVLLFLIYTTVYKQGIDKEKKTAGFILMYAHYFIIVGLEMSVILYGYYIENSLNPLFSVLLLSISLLCFFGGILSNLLVYGKKAYNYSALIIKNVAFFVIWIIVSILLKEWVIIVLVLNIAFFLFLLYQLKREMTTETK